MKTMVVCLLLVFAAHAGFGRTVRVWTRLEMTEKADLIVIAKARSTIETSERGVMPKLNNFDLVGLSTAFEVETVLKGNKMLKQFVLHHYGLATQYEALINGPSLVPFGYNDRTGRCTPPDRASYILYLKKEADGRYAPVDTQVDPADSSIRKLPPGWKIEDLK